MKPIKIAEIIDTWYFEWKGKMTDNDEPHRLGFAKEDLKVKFEKYLEEQNGKRNNN